MDIQFYGANCITFATKQARVVIDDTLADMGAKSVSKPGDIALFTDAHGQSGNSPKIVIDGPGEYEASGVSIYGIAARSHMDEAGQKNATMYKLVIDDFKILVTGHIYPELTDKQLEAIGMIDVMVVPIGGNGYTLDGVGALKLVKKVEPKMVIPTHYDDSSLSFPMVQQPLADALKGLAMEPKETVAKLKLKAGDLSDVTQLVIVEKS
ncbi:MAG TPA: MBL fold metallo-hydrolase [Candidatus Saccharimonadales bacterium]|nr:MBL fold metallo-hydrolase [Candidatus Saccharimonadales bacterium]